LATESQAGAVPRGVRGGGPPSEICGPPCGPQKTFKIRPHQASEQKASTALVVILNVF